MQQDHARTESHRAENLRSESSRSEHVRGERAASRATAQMADMGASVVGASDMGASNVKAGLRMQQEMFDMLQDISRDWLVRGTAQAELAFKLPNKLTTAHSPSDAFAAYQEWLSEWLNLCSEGSARFVSDGQKLVDTGVRCFSAVMPAKTN
jgi:hypothetical protein